MMNPPNQEELIENNDSLIEDEMDNVDGDDDAFAEKITKPFDPSKIRVESKAMIIDALLKRIRHQEIELTPGFQRKAGLWKEDAQSQLIESLLIRIPLPAFYMDATNDNKWLVVDGLQRLTTLKRFMVDKTLTLQGLEFLDSLEGKSYNEMPRNLLRRIEETQVIVYLIEEGTPPDVKFNIFRRINTGGLPLSTQEIRHALYQGKATELLAKLVHSEEFKKATANRISDERMAARAFILRWIVDNLYYPTQGNNLGMLDSSEILNDTMSRLNKMSDNELDRLERTFRKSMQAIYEIFGKTAFLYMYDKGIWKTGPSLNKSFFEAFSINFTALDSKQLQLLVTRKELLKRKFQELRSKEENNIGYYHCLDQNRFSEIKQLILEVLS
jgi:uncharacterized protein with ParB-like and HNH nuclease domain